MIPLPFPTSNITSHYGNRAGGFHDGTDWGGYAVGTAIRASAPGKVHSVTYNARGGHRVGIQYDGIPGTYLYCHLNGTAPVRQGARVVEGTVIGHIGWSGNVIPKGPAGANLHLSHYVSGSKHQSPLVTMGGRVARAGGSGSAASSGSVSQDTKNRQSWLNKSRGEKLTVDGIEGPLTKAAYKRYQKFLGVTVDGVWGPKTQQAHQKYYDKVNAPKGRATIRRGSTGQNVRDLQSRLKKNYALYAGRLVVDGKFGPATEAAVKEFQRRAGLTVDGIVGPRTWARLGL